MTLSMCTHKIVGNSVCIYILCVIGNRMYYGCEIVNVYWKKIILF